ncbi:MAG: alpha/beta fold hydrolase [Solirubrobacteraceae bacterium]
MQPLFEYREAFAGYDTRVLELEGSGPPIVLLHGYADSADTWRLVLDRLARAERRAIAVDLPSFGEAAPLDGGPMLPQYDAFAAAVIESAVAGAGEPAVVAGNSLGGCVALRVAGAAPEAAAPEALPIAAVMPIAPAGLDMAGWFAVVERDQLLRSLLAVPTPLPQRVVRDTVGRIYRTLAFADQSRVEGKVIDHFTSHFGDRDRIRDRLATARRLLPELADPFDLPCVHPPVLLVWGTRDRMVSATGAERILAEVPTVRYEPLEGAGHCPQIERADAVTALLLDAHAAPVR